MFRKDSRGEDRGRRPVLFGSDRFMIEEIRDSLSHVYASQNPDEEADGAELERPGPVGAADWDSTLARTELSLSTPNLADKLAPDQRNGNHSSSASLQTKMTRLGYHQKALAQIRNSLKPYKNCDGGTRNGAAVLKACQAACREEQDAASITDLANGMGQEENFCTLEPRLSKARSSDDVLDSLDISAVSVDTRNGISTKSFPAGFPAYGGKVIRKPSFEEKYRHHSAGLDARSHHASGLDRSASPGPENGLPPPPLPPRGPGNSRATPPPEPGKARTPVQREPLVPNSARLSPSSGSYQLSSSSGYQTPSPTGPGQKAQKVVYGKPPAPPPYGQNAAAYCSPPTSLAFAQSTGVTRGIALPATGPVTPGQSPRALTPTQQQQQQQQQMLQQQQQLQQQQLQQQQVVPGQRMIAQAMPHRLPSPNQPSPAASPKPVAMQAWGAKQAPVIVHSVKSREVQKPMLQAATAPVIPPRNNLPRDAKPVAPSSLPFAAPSNGQNGQSPSRLKSVTPGSRPKRPPRLSDTSPSPTYSAMDNIQSSSRLTSRSNSPISRTPNQSPVSQISSLSTPSTNSDPPPPPYLTPSAPSDPPPPPYHSRPGLDSDVDKRGFEEKLSDEGVKEGYRAPDLDPPPLPASLPPDESEDGEPTRCTSPIPERRPEAALRDAQRRDFTVRNYSTQAFKFYMEQHVENLLKSHQQRLDRRIQLENEMAKVGLSEEAQQQMRKMLNQKESNYIRLKRAKMNKSMFQSIRTLGIGAFGKVQLVRKRDTQHLYAMKTLRKENVLRRNQVAHVKAERDILAEADNEWVVKLYYSFQDTDSLYFVMEYSPGGDMMNLLIKLGIFQPALAQFYIAELVLAIESVHSLGFTHRDIKPDNILIDRSGHIKLTDFGLCTGFRWTHNSKYYQKDGCHERQDSMDPASLGGFRTGAGSGSGAGEPLKPLVRRRQQQRHLAHSLVGTPNYIAPEVLVRSGYTSCCDWWSVGVILYEMLVGQPPFLANDPAETQYKVIHWYHYLQIPREARLSDAATDLILRLCCGAEDRLGRHGAHEIQAHHFFHNLRFDGLRRQRAPHVPVITHPTDTSNFDPVESGDSDSDSDAAGEDPRWPRDEDKQHPEHAFYEFTFRRFFDEGGHPYPASRPEHAHNDAPVYV